MAELVHDGRTGLLFEPAIGRFGAEDHSLLDDPERSLGMRRAARREYEEKYSAERIIGC